MFWNRLSISVIAIITLTTCATENAGPYVDHTVLIDTAHWLRHLEEQPSFVYVDLRSPELFSKGHLPGAINLTRKDVRKIDFEFSGMALEPDSLAILLGNKGISSDDWLILYDEKGGVEASRLWWLLRVYGHERVKILNGDLQLFETDLETDINMRKAQQFEYKGTPKSDWSVDYYEFEKLRAIPSTIVLDCRSAAEYNGEYIKPGAYLAGHIDGAVNLCYSHTVDNTTSNLKIKSPDVLAKLYATYAQPDDTVLVYCQSGVRSAHTLLIMRQILNYQHVYNFDGSWIEWSYRNQNIQPIENSKVKML